MKIEIRKPVYFVPAACSQTELFISRNDYIDSYKNDHDLYYDELVQILSMYCSGFGFEPEMTEETAEEMYKNIAENKKTIEGVYCGICEENGEKTLYMAYAAYGAPGKRITVIAPEEEAIFEENE